MIKLISVAVLLLSFRTFAEPSTPDLLLDISFEKNHMHHRYSIKEVFDKGSTYVLSFTDERQKTQSMKISEDQARSIKNRATRIIWENLYRKPASSTNCLVYVTLKTDSEQTKICKDNAVLVGESYGFLNALRGAFR